MNQQEENGRDEEEHEDWIAVDPIPKMRSDGRRLELFQSQSPDVPDLSFVKVGVCRVVDIVRTPQVPIGGQHEYPKYQAEPRSYL